MNLFDALFQGLEVGGKYGVDDYNRSSGDDPRSRPLWQGQSSMGMFGQDDDPSGTTVNPNMSRISSAPTPGSMQAQMLSQPQSQSYQTPPNSMAQSEQPRHHGGLRDFLGSVADALYVGAGGKESEAPYASRVQERDIHDAMSTFSQDPLGSIQKLAQTQPKLARQYYQDFIKQQHEQVQEDNVRQQMQDRTRGNIAALLYSARNDPAAFAKNLPIAINLAKQRGIDPSSLPQTYDHDAITQFANGAVSVDKQVDNEANAERLANNKSYRDARLAQIGRNTDSQIQARNVSNFQRAASAGNAAVTAQRTADQIAHPEKYHAPRATKASTPAPAAKPVKVIRQNGHQFEIYADGSHKYVAGT